MPKSYRSFYELLLEELRQGRSDYITAVLLVILLGAMICLAVIMISPEILRSLLLLAPGFQASLAFGVLGAFGLIITAVLMLLSALATRKMDSSNATELQGLTSRITDLTGQELNRVFRLLEIVAAIATIVSCMISFVLLLSGSIR